VDRIRKLEGSILRYGWGSRHKLAALQGRAAPTPEPEAELWFGSHPVAPARIETEAGAVELGDWIARDPERCLGSAVARRFGSRLPFLVKLLAVERPLSLQVHPDARGAREGFERENHAGIPLGAATRCYRDPHAKPELVCALERFTALHGFRPLEELAENLAVSGFADRLPGLSALRQSPVPDAWRIVFGELLALAPEGRRQVLAAASERAGEASCEPEAVRWVARLASAFPDDVGVLAPLLLRLVVLEPGQALFVPPGVVHCYLEGLALEAMASSDNVLRGGLTSKHVDRGELLRAACFAPAASEPSEPCPVSAIESRHRIQAEEFAVSSIEVQPGTGFACKAVVGAEVLVCVSGCVHVQGARSDGTVALRAGQAAWVPAAARAYGVEGAGRVYRVRVPEPGEGEGA
jgi:mannose-6-phosphate isomerase